MLGDDCKEKKIFKTSIPDYVNYIMQKKILRKLNNNVQML